MQSPIVSFFEVAVYTVREPESFAPIQRETHDHVAKIDGFLHGVRLKSTTSSALYADVIAWRSVEAAKKAADQVQQDPHCAPLMARLDQLRLFAHYTLPVDPAAFAASLRAGPLVEIGAYSVRDASVQSRVHARLHGMLRAEAGCRASAPGRQNEDPERFLDLIVWESKEAHERAAAALQKDAELGELFGGIRELDVLDLFASVP